MAIPLLITQKASYDMCSMILGKDCLDGLLRNVQRVIFQLYSAIKALFLYLNLCQSILLDSLSCSFTSISFLIT